MLKFRSFALKLALFATGLSGIVAEYILSTLATYFLGDSVFQWTMIVSIMLFAMGLGSRLSKYLKSNLLQKFIIIEFTLSILTSFSSLLAYTAAAYTVYTGMIIYTMSILIGILIGMEIPLVIRINREFENLRINVASVMEKDYYGSLLGGLFFAFVGLPYLGLTYTPFVLGAINFIVALGLFFLVRSHLKKKLRLGLTGFALATAMLLTIGVTFATPVILYGEQQRYKDKIVYEKQSRYQRIVITQWQNNFWLYINGNQQLSSLDEAMYHEPLVHPAMSLSKNPQHILVLGGGDGCAVREILKYPQVAHITLVDLDPAMTDLGLHHPILVNMNEGALRNPKVSIINKDGYNYLEQTEAYYDMILVDLPDPKTVELGRLYSYEFYKLCNRHLRPNGILITQAGSPYYATRAFLCIDKTMRKAGFNTQQLHNQVLTLGEWGWILGAKGTAGLDIKSTLQNMRFENVKTAWLNHEAMSLITSFGKNIYAFTADTVEVNTIHNPVLYQYYLKGNWDLY